MFSETRVKDVFKICELLFSEVPYFSLSCWLMDFISTCMFCTFVNAPGRGSNMSDPFRQSEGERILEQRIDKVSTKKRNRKKISMWELLNISENFGDLDSRSCLNKITVHM